MGCDARLVEKWSISSDRIGEVVHHRMTSKEKKSSEGRDAVSLLSCSALGTVTYLQALRRCEGRQVCADRFRAITAAVKENLIAEAWSW